MSAPSGGALPVWCPSEGTHFEPTPEGWAAFRRAQAETLEAKACGERSMLYPILGDRRYWFAPPRGAPRIVSCDLDDAEVRIALADGRRIAAPLSWWPILRDASPEERARREIGERGDMVRFPLLNTEILVDNLLFCRGGADPSGFASACTRSEDLMDTVGSLLYRAAAERAEEIGQLARGDTPPDWALDAVADEARGWARSGCRKEAALPPTVRWHRFPIVPLREAVGVRLGLLDAAAARAEAAEALGRAEAIRSHRAGVAQVHGADRPVMHFGGGVVSDPAVLVGAPAPVCTRVPVWLILAHLASGMTVAQITAPNMLPHLVEEDVDAALRAASAILDEIRAPLPRRVQTQAEAADDAEPQGGAETP